MSDAAQSETATKQCPECGASNTETAHVEWYDDHVDRVMICNECPTEWAIEYGEPIVKDKMVFEEMV